MSHTLKTLQQAIKDECEAFERGQNVKFAIWSFEHKGYWKLSGYGYTPNLEEAGTYNFEEALEICVEANKYDKVPQEAMVPLNKE